VKKLWIYTLLISSLCLNLVFLIKWISNRCPDKPEKARPVPSFADFCRDVYQNCPNDSNEILFVGNSLTYSFNVSEYYPGKPVKNRGIRGDLTSDVLFRLSEIMESKPAKIFLLIGINDILNGVQYQQITENIGKIVGEICTSSPKTKIYIQSLLPVAGEASYEFLGDKDLANQRIEEVNGFLKEICRQRRLEYIDLYSRFLKNNELDQTYSWDGLHINGKGYDLWSELIKSKVAE
jgi:lysophospholipase L1-like esterase